MEPDGQAPIGLGCVDMVVFRGNPGRSVGFNLCSARTCRMRPSSGFRADPPDQMSRFSICSMPKSDATA